MMEKKWQLITTYPPFSLLYRQAVPGLFFYKSPHPRQPCVPFLRNRENCLGHQAPRAQARPQGSAGSGRGFYGEGLAGEVLERCSVAATCSNIMHTKLGKIWGGSKSKVWAPRQSLGGPTLTINEAEILNQQVHQTPGTLRGSSCVTVWRGPNLEYGAANAPTRTASSLGLPLRLGPASAWGLARGPPGQSNSCDRPEIDMATQCPCGVIRDASAPTFATCSFPSRVVDGLSRRLLNTEVIIRKQGCRAGLGTLRKRIFIWVGKGHIGIKRTTNVKIPTP